MKKNQIIKSLTICIGATFASMLACSCRGTEQSEQITDSEYALQEITAGDEIEAAHIAARNAAKEFVGKEFPDTMSIQELLLRAKSKQSRYIKSGNKKAVEEFDSTFVSTLRTVRPDIGRQINIVDSDSE